MRVAAALLAAIALLAAAPMTYATQQHLIDRFGEQELVELTNRDGGATIIESAVTAALQDADGEINGYLSAKYTLPLSPVPVVLERIAADIARYHLYQDRVTEIVKRRHEDAIRFLKAVASGTVQLGVDAANEAPASSGGPQYEACDRVFTRDTLDDYS